MTDFNVSDVARFEHTLPQIETILNDLRASVAALPGIGKVVVDFDVPSRRLSQGSFSIGVSAVCHDGGAIDWWITIWYDHEKWMVDYAVHRHNRDEDGSHEVESFPSLIARTPAELGQCLVKASDELSQVPIPPDLFASTSNSVRY